MAETAVGNMNVGKSSLFSWLTDKTGGSSMNFPGSTVTIKSGQIKEFDATIYDTPGIYSIFSANEDEKVSRDILLPHEKFNDINYHHIISKFTFNYCYF